MTDGFCAITPIKAGVDERTGLDEEGSRRVYTSCARDADGHSRRLARLTIRIEDFNKRSLGKLTVA